MIACSDDDNVVNSQRDLQDKIETLVKEQFNTYKLKYLSYPGGLAIKVLHGEDSYFATTGIPNATENIHFRTASITKVFTSTAILLLHQQGKLNVFSLITDKIPGTDEPYVPDTPEYNIPFKSSITILDLLRHRAGVFDVTNFAIPDTISGNYPYKGSSYLEYISQSDKQHTFTFDELISINAKHGLYFFIPTKGYHYSNTGYSILGKIIERVSKKTYQTFVLENVLTPLGMTNSSMPVLGNDQIIPNQFAQGFIYSNNGIQDVTLSNVSGNVAEGNLITTPKDLAYASRKLLSGQGILNTNTVNSIMMNCIPVSDASNGSYGCGLTFTNNLGYGHNGAHEGYLSYMVYDPINDITIAMFTNTWNLKDDMNTMKEQVYDLLEGTAYKIKSIITTK
jgi:D-alanyl-D-alanine carboxypeptidase